MSIDDGEMGVVALVGVVAVVVLCRPCKGEWHGRRGVGCAYRPDVEVRRVRRYPSTLAVREANPATRPVETMVRGCGCACSAARRPVVEGTGLRRFGEVDAEFARQPLNRLLAFEVVVGIQVAHDCVERTIPPSELLLSRVDASLAREVRDALHARPEAVFACGGVGVADTFGLACFAPVAADLDPAALVLGNAPLGLALLLALPETRTGRFVCG